MAEQIVSRNYRPLFSFPVPASPGTYVSPGRYETYGPSLIAEPSPFSSGAFFMILFLLVAGLILTGPSYRLRTQAFLGVLATVDFGCLVLTESRITLLGAILGACTLLGLIRHPWRRNVATVALLVVAGFGLATAAERWARVQTVPEILSTPADASASRPPSDVSIVVPAVVGRFTPEPVNQGFSDRFRLVWGPLLQMAAKQPITGYGKGAIGLTAGLGDGDEAHDSYLRILVESGVGGLTAFVSILFGVVVLSHAAVRSALSASDRGLAAATAACAVAMTLAATLQDAFTPVLPNELFWLLVGLCAAVYRQKRVRRATLATAHG